MIVPFCVLACFQLLVTSHRSAEAFRLITNSKSDIEEHEQAVHNSSERPGIYPFFSMADCEGEDGSLEELEEFTGSTTVLMGTNQVMCCCLSSTGVCRLSNVKRSVWGGLPSCTSLHGPGYQSHNAADAVQKCTVQPKTLCEALAAFKPIVKKCALGTPWTNVLHLGRGAPDEVASLLAEQAKNRVVDPISSLKQARQGFCGPAAVLVLFAVAYPIDYLDMVESLFCEGEWKGTQGLKIDTELSLQAKWRKFFNSKGADDNILDFSLTNDRVRITPIDWMTMGSFRNVYDIKFGNIKLGSVGAGLLWQGSTTDMIELWLNGLFSNSEKVLDTAPGFSDLWTRGRRVAGMDRWDVLTDAISTNPFVFGVLRMQIAEDIDEFNRNQKATLNEIIIRDGFTNHYLTLVAIQGNDCITWTWGHFLTFTCDDLRKRTEQGVLTDLSAGDQERLTQLKEYAVANVDLNRYNGWGSIRGTVT